METVPEIKCGHKKLSILTTDCDWLRGNDSDRPFTLITYQCRSCGLVFQSGVDGRLKLGQIKIRNAQLRKR